MPETKTGKCPFCEREGVMLTLITGIPYRSDAGELVVPCEWVCARCLAMIEEDRRRNAECAQST